MTETGSETEPVIVGTLAAYKAWNVLKAAFVPVDPVVFTETFLRVMSPSILTSVEPGRAFAFDVDPGHLFRLERDPDASNRPYIVALAGSSGRRTYLHEERPGAGSSTADESPGDDGLSRLAPAPIHRSAREARRQEIYRFLRG
jgi:hypothetical protein